MKTLLTSATLWLLVVAGHAAAQVSGSSPYVIAETVTIHSKILNEDRRISIFNPDTVGGNVTPTYPVLYLLEENDMAMVTGMVKYLSSYNEQMPAMLVVGIDGGGDRMRDLTPTHALYDNHGKMVDGPDSWLATSGGGEAFLRFVHEEVMPYVEQHYHAAPFRILAGHSVGGLTALHALNAHPDMFNAYLAVSPSLWWDRGGEVAVARKTLSLPNSRKAFLFLADSPEGRDFNRYVDDYLHVLRTKKLSGLYYTHAVYRGETHGSIAVKAYYDGLRYLYPDWEASDAQDSAKHLQAHFGGLSQRLGYDVQPGQGRISDWGASFLRAGKIDDAIAMYRWNVANFPTTASLYGDLGDAYAKKGDKAAAVQAYTTALTFSPGDIDLTARLAKVQP
jgi:hypothetical protein